MQSNSSSVLSSSGRILIFGAAFAVLVAGMREASSVLMPLALSTFIAIICWPPLFWMHQKRIPFGVGILIIMIVLLTVMFLFAVFVDASVNQFVRNLPAYQIRLRQDVGEFSRWLSGHDIHLSAKLLKEQFDPGKIMRLAGRMVSGLTNVFTNMMLIFFSVVFLLLEGRILPAKLRAALGHSTAEEHFERFVETVRRYLGIKSATSLTTGLAVAAWLAFLGVDYPVLWGLTAFLLNFVPTIGSIIAAIPAALLALVQLGADAALYTALGYLVINILVGNIIEPRVMGAGLGLSTLVVFLSLIFWGWVFGPIGMLLSIPFTMIAKIALATSDETRWIAMLLGGEVPPVIPLEPPPVARAEEKVGRRLEE